MKNLLFLFGILYVFLVNSQTSNNPSSPANKVDAPVLSDSKSSFITGQEYLRKTVIQRARLHPGDSVFGFNENVIRQDLLARQFSGIEVQNVVNLMKRDFINKKYSIGVYAPGYSQNNPQPNNKPLGGVSTINVAPCVNEDFEASTVGQYTGSANANAITGWIIESTTSQSKQLACNSPGNVSWTSGSPEFSIVSTPILNVPHIGNIPASPLGGTKVAALNDAVSGFTVTRISTSFNVTSANASFHYAYAGSWDGTGHQCCDQPFFTINVYDCQGQLMACSSVSLTPPGPNCSNSLNGYSITTAGIAYTNWQARTIDLTPYIGSCVTVRVVNGDCNGGAHHGRLFFDANCGGQFSFPGVPGIDSVQISAVSFCASSSLALISAPMGYSTYSWVAPSYLPPIPASQATLSTLTVTNPIVNSCYTVHLTGLSGCQFSAVNCITTSTIAIIGLATGTTCQGGSSGSATVVANGSGSGYVYNWLNSSSVTVGTQSIATGLAAGVYSIIVSGQGSSACGIAKATVTVTAGPPGLKEVFKPYCGSVAYLGTTGGTNFQWYNNLTPISPSNGGTAPTLTVPGAPSIYYLSYISNAGCADSVKFTLAPMNPGFLTVSNISWVCPGANNGTAMVNLIPAQGSNFGMNTYTVLSTGTTPAYNSSVAMTTGTQFPLTGLSAGSYTVNGFDGSCKYNTAFNVSAYNFNFTLTPNSPSLCPGNCIAAGVNFTSTSAATQYSYLWMPNQFLSGNANNYPSTIICPTVPAGTQSTLIYTVTVTPNVVNCPLSKTLSIIAINPATPTISPIKDLCNNSAPFQMTINPTGGTFFTTYPGTVNPISIGGLINAAASFTGANTFTYSIAISTCVVTQTASYYVSKFYPATLTSTVPPLCVTNAPFNLMNVVQNTTNGSWYGAGVQNGNTFNPAPLNNGNYTISYKTVSSPNPNACPDSASVVVPVTKTITPAITQVPEFCTSWSAINMTVNPTGGAWYGNQMVSSVGVITPSNAPQNPFTPSTIASYSVIIGPCLNTATTVLNASRFNPAALSSTIGHQCAKGPTVNLLSVVQSTVNGVWFGPGSSVNNNIFSPSGIQTGTITLTYSTMSSPNLTLCTDVSSIAVSVLNPATPKISNVGPICNNAAALQLTVTPSTGMWTASPYLTSGGVFTPSLTSVGSNAVQYVIGTSTCNSQSTKFVNVEAFVSAKITSQLPDQCNNGPGVNLAPFTLNSGGVWSGPGIAGQTFNPSLTGSGNFILIHNTASSPSGLCPDQDQMAVNVFSLAVPVLTKAGPFCNTSAPVQLTVSPVGGLFGGASMGVVSLAGKFEPAHAAIGDNIVNYSITSGPCVAYAQTTVSVEKFISADFAKVLTPICLIPGKTNPVNMDSYVQNPGGSWDGKGMIGNMFDPFKANIGKNNTLKYSTHSMPTATLCPDESEITVEVRNVPVVKAFSNITSTCSPAEIVFNTPSATEGTGTWNFDDGSEVGHGFTVSHIYTTPGTYNVTFTYKDDIGCEALPAMVNPVTVNEIPKADFSVPDEIFISSPDVQLTNLTTVLGNNTYVWKIGNLYTLDQVNPLVSLPKIGRYQITLVATSILGCKDEITKTIEVKNDFNIYIPTSFSPNFDGLNDVFMPVFSEYGLDHKSFEMEIFDRWGHSLYRTKDVSKGWDGSVQNKGEPLKEEVYIYRIKYKDLDGNAYNKMGHVSLLK